jgi:DNA-binding NtrC family response regulator
MARVLIVDDEPQVLATIKKYLTDDYEVFTAEDARAAISLFQREMPAVVVTDIRMPGMDGIELMRRLKGMGRDVEVVILTGHGDMQTAIESLRLGASDFLVKPIDVDSLKKAIQAALEKLSRKDRILGLIGKTMREMDDKPRKG